MQHYQKKQLIITADDFGYCGERNQGIVDCFLAGGVTRASLMMTGVAVTDAILLAKQHGIPLGIKQY